MKQYEIEMRMKENKRKEDSRRAMKIAARDERISAIKQRRFDEEVKIQQKSQMIKRNEEYMKMCKKVYRLASDLEKNKLIEDKKRYKETEMQKQTEKQLMVHKIENLYKDRIDMLKEKIDREKFERQLAEEA